MISSSELTDFYYKTLYPTLQNLEVDRKDLKKRVMITGAVLSAFTLFIIFIFSSSIAQNFDILIFIGAAYVGLGAGLFKFLAKDYTQEFKQKIIRPLIHAIDKSLSYYPSAHISSSIFNNSTLFEKPDKIEGNDLVKGKIDGTHIEFCDIFAQKIDKDIKNNNKNTTIFRGLFIIAEFNKNFKGKTVVLPDTAQSSFGDLIGGWLQSNNHARDNLIKMDDNNFEKEFVVYSTDQIEARYILSHLLMKKLLAFKTKSKHPLHVSFIDNNIYLAIEYEKDLFEPSVFRSLLDYKVAMEYIKTLHLAIGIVEELKLNQKLWSKR